MKLTILGQVLDFLPITFVHCAEEINYLISNIPDGVDPELDWKFVVTGFTKKLQRAFESQSEALSQISSGWSMDDEQEEVDEHSFLQDVVDWCTCTR